MELIALLDHMTAIHRGAILPCQENDGELWFAETPALLEQAKSLCAPCPIQAQCLAGAVDRREPWGVWGGQLFDAGQVVARKRPRGRPRKDDPYRVAELSGVA